MIRRPSAARRADHAGLAVGAVALVAVVGLSVTVGSTTYDTWGAFIWMPLALLACVPFARHAARMDGDPSVVRLLMLSAVAKVGLGTVAQLVVTYGLYGGSADAGRYHNAGAELAESLRTFSAGDLGALGSTRFIEVFTGVVYAVTGVTRVGGFIVYSLLAWVGLWCLYRAFRVAFPTGDRRRYALLVMFWPSLLFWPSTVGKDAFMLLCLGVAVLGLARLVTGRWTGAVGFALGLWGAMVVRPHVALLVVVGTAMAALVVGLGRRDRALGRNAGPGFRIVLVVLVLGAAPIVTASVEARFGLDELSLESAEETFEETVENTGRGGSEFDAPQADDPVSFLRATVTVLFRPLPFEVRNFQALLASAEGLGLLVLVVVSRRRLVRAVRDAVRVPYLAFSLTYVAAFIFAFSRIQNFGILARQRAQLFPILFVLLAAVPALRGSDDDAVEGDEHTDQPGPGAARDGAHVPTG